MGKALGICDLGSNTIRFVVYADKSRVPEVLAIDRTLCRLGRQLNLTGKLDPEGAALALKTLKRYQREAKKLGVKKLEVVCTAALRDASDGPRFLKKITAQTGLNPQVISGELEAKLAAYGVLFGMPKADGVLGDLGGGSLELVNLTKGQPGQGMSLPLGSLRYEGLTREQATHKMEKNLATVPWLKKVKGRPFIVLGGSWRSIAALYIRDTKYKPDIVDALEVKAEKFAAYCDKLSKATPQQLEKTAVWLEKRTEALPTTALLLSRIINLYKPKTILVSAGGVREGSFYARLTPAQRKQDPLLAVAERLSGKKAPKGNRITAAAALLKPLKLDAMTLDVPGLAHADRFKLARLLK